MRIPIRIDADRDRSDFAFAKELGGKVMLSFFLQTKIYMAVDPVDM